MAIVYDTQGIPRSTAKTWYGLFKDVQTVILAEPRRILMDVWGGTPGCARTVLADRFGDSQPAGPPCGTVGCIGGWVGLLGNCARHLSANVELQSQDAFKCALYRLFYSWSENLSDYGTPKYARSVARRIERFRQRWARELKKRRAPGSR